MSHLGVYQVVKQLGEGGMATAWLAVAPTGNYVVLKVPLLTDPSMAVRLRDEAQAGRRIHHPHVVSTLDFFVDAGRPVLVIEFVDGCALRDLRTRDNFRNPLPAAGLSSDGIHFTYGRSYFDDDWAMTRGWTWRNLTALLTLNSVLYAVTPDPAILGTDRY